MTIWLIIIIILSLLGYTNRAAQKGSARKSPNNGHTGANIDDENSPINDYEQLMRQALGLPPIEKPRKGRKAQKRVQTPPPVTPPTPQPVIATEEPKESNSKKNRLDEITEDFSLEKAVIYSEILTPKYKEYE